MREMLHCKELNGKDMYITHLEKDWDNNMKKPDFDTDKEKDAVKFAVKPFTSRQKNSKKKR